MSEDKHLKPIVDRLANDREYQAKELMALVRSATMKRVLEIDDKPVKIESLAEVLPNWYQRERYAQLLAIDPVKAEAYRKVYARTPSKLVRAPESAPKPMTRAQVLERFEFSRKKREINSKPLNRRV